MPKISVIVPVYNTEKYLKKCLDSIINQTYQNFEIIIVNDGSTDNSEKIIEEYKNNYPEKIKNFVKENSGLSDTRNFGIKNSSGDYLSFVDSDDYIDEKLFENLLPHIDNEIDLIKFKLIKVNKQYKELEKICGPTFECCSGQEAFNTLFGYDVLIEPSCLYLYKSAFFKNNNFKFSTKLYHEDFGLTPIVMVNAKSVVSINLYGYYYVQANNSITRNNDYSKTKKMAYDLFKHYNNMLVEISKITLNKITLDNLKQYYTNSILLATKTLNKFDKTAYINEIKKQKLVKNIKVKNIKQLLKKFLLNINIKLYLKMK